MATSSSPIGSELTFSLQNADGKSVIYIGKENELTLTITNNIGKNIIMWKGTPVAESTIGDKLTSFYLSWANANMIDPADFQKISIQAKDWQAVYFPDEGNWGLAPSTNLMLAHGQSISFAISNIQPTAGARPGAGQLNVDYYNWGNITADAEQCHVSLANPPQSGLKDLKIGNDLNLGFVSKNQIFVSADPERKITNDLLFYISNPSDAHPLIPDTVNWGKQPPLFILSFVYAQKNSPGYNALTSAELAADMTLSISNINKNTWQIESAKNNPVPQWVLKPQQHSILGTGSNAEIELNLSNVISRLSPGITQMYLQWSNIPGYNDGGTALLINKVMPTAGILYFNNYPNNINLGNSGYLSWETFAIKSNQYIELSYQQNENIVRLNSLTGQIPLNEQRFKVTPEVSTTYSLSLYDSNNPQAPIAEAPQRTIGVDIPPPKFRTFAARLISKNDDRSFNFDLSWEVLYADKVSFDEDANYLLANVKSFSLKTAQAKHTLTAWRDGKALAKQEIDLSAKIIDFSAAQTSILLNGSTILNWQTQYSFNKLLPGNQSLQASGDLQISPKKMTTYTLNADGITPKSTQVTVDVVAPVQWKLWVWRNSQYFSNIEGFNFISPWKNNDKAMVFTVTFLNVEKSKATLVCGDWKVVVRPSNLLPNNPLLLSVSNSLPPQEFTLHYSSDKSRVALSFLQDGKTPLYATATLTEGLPAIYFADQYYDNNSDIYAFSSNFHIETV